MSQRASDPRRCSVSTKVTRSELDRLEALAASEGRSVSNYLRRLIGFALDEAAAHLTEYERGAA